MLWLDIVDILYLIVGFIAGFIVCCLINRDLMQDECTHCAYRDYVEEVLNDE